MGIEGDIEGTQRDTVCNGMCMCASSGCYFYIFILMLQKSGNLHNASSSHVYATLCKNNCTISLKLPVAGCRVLGAWCLVPSAGCWIPGASWLVQRVCLCTSVASLLMPHIVKLVQA